MRCCAKARRSGLYEPARQGEAPGHLHLRRLRPGTVLVHRQVRQWAGWPSSWAPIADAAVGTERDTTLGMIRISVHCSRCGGHLGHVFNDGPRGAGRASLDGGRAERRRLRRDPAPLLLGIATGLLWAPRAEPILGLILTGAVLQGANVGTSLLLLAHSAGASTSLALLAGGKIYTLMKRSLSAGVCPRASANRQGRACGASRCRSSDASRGETLREPLCTTRLYYSGGRKPLICLVSLENQFLGGMMADREGFEPPIPLHVCRISSAVHSTTLPPVRGRSGRGGVLTTHCIRPAQAFPERCVHNSVIALKSFAAMLLFLDASPSHD